MQNFSNLLDSMRMKGISVSLVDGRLKVEPAIKITDELRASIKEHRQGIIAALLMGGMSGGDQVLETERAILRCPVGELESGGLKLGRQRNCLLCGLPLDQDGGDCWHRAFHVGDDSP